MMPDHHGEESIKTDLERDELVGRIGNLYTKKGSSPPTQLRGAVRHWLGLSVQEIVDAIEQHFAEHRRLYVSGSGDGFFYMVEAAIRRAWQAKHPTRDHIDDEPNRRRHRCDVDQRQSAGWGSHDAGTPQDARPSPDHRDRSHHLEE